MVLISHGHSSSTVKDSNIAMNQKQISLNNGRRGAANNSPQWPSRPSLLQKAVGSPVSTGSSPMLKSTPLGAAKRPKTASKDVAAPAVESLNPNITPRSSARKTRVDSASSTPNSTPAGTPTNSRPTSMIFSRVRDEGVSNIPNIGMKGTTIGRIGRSPSISSDRSGSNYPHKSESKERSLQSSRATSPESKPMFFRADDVRPGLASIPSERFYEPEYKLGRVRDGSIDYTGTNWSATSISPPVERPKFFHANGAVENTIVPPQLITGRASRPRSQILTVTESPTSPQPRRAPSPLKDEVLSRKSSLSKASPRQHTRLVSNPNVALEQGFKSPEALSSGLSNISRRSSLNTPSYPRFSHARSPSVGTIGSAQTRRSSFTLTNEPNLKSPNLSLTSKPEFSQDIQKQPISIPDAPKSKGFETSLLGKSKLDQMNELAANARRERKVLDLEISNSSLLAINRTLEREMRKQNAELRRFRRLSRTGRISAAPSSRSAFKTLSILTESDYQNNNVDDDSDQSSVFLSGEDEEQNEIDSAVSSSTGSNSGSHFYDAGIRTKDSKHLHLNLARHRALLVNSQKLNQSIKRCLGWTEDLITDGKKALEYRVHVGNEQPRGRVLPPDELGEDEFRQRQGLLSPGISDRAVMNWEIDRVDADQNERLKPPGYLEDDYRATHEDAADEAFDDTSNPDLELRDEWDRIKADVQTPDELINSGTGVQGLKDYLSNLGPSWGL